MKKNFLRLMMLFVAAVLTNNAFAQGSLLATLNHEGTVSTFYGASAWKNAHDAAVNGDGITLSSGTFVAVDSTKAITVRGAGMSIDTHAVSEPTIISGNFTINIAEQESNRLTLEGIYSNHIITYKKVVNPMFLKCRLDRVDYISSSVLKDASFIHCRIADFRLGTNCSASCVNSVIQNPYSLNNSTSNFEFINCCLIGNMGKVYASSFRNCIMCDNNNSNYIHSSCTTYNCVCLTANSYFKDIANVTNKYLTDYATLFKTYQGTTLENIDSESFELTEEAKTQHLGADGTEVGIYGGILPYNPTPSNPQIIKCNVGAKSTADGKLSVDIEVNAAE